MTPGLLLTKESTAWAAAAFDTSAPPPLGDVGEACTAAAVPAVTSATANTAAAMADRGESFKGCLLSPTPAPPGDGRWDGPEPTGTRTCRSVWMDGVRANLPRPAIGIDLQRCNDDHMWGSLRQESMPLGGPLPAPWNVRVHRWRAPISEKRALNRFIRWPVRGGSAG